jgi:hypothetical protein
MDEFAAGEGSQAVWPAILWPAAAVAIATGLFRTSGEFDVPGVLWVTAGLALTWVGLIFSSRHVQKASAKWGWVACLIGAMIEWHELDVSSPTYFIGPPRQYYTVALPMLAILAGAAIGGNLIVRRIAIAVLLIAYFGIGVWLFHHSGKPWIDTYDQTLSACDAISHGKDPYAIDFPDVYAHQAAYEAAFYPPHWAVNGRVRFGYAYMPLGLIVAYLGQTIAGDFRLAFLAALVAAAGLLAFVHRHRQAAAAAVLLLLMPRNMYVIEYSWTEPAALLCLAAVVFCAVRAKGVLPYVAGLLLVSKQHMPMIAPLLLLLMPEPWKLKEVGKFYLKAIATGAVVTLPAILCNPRAFWHSVVEVQLKSPFRSDSLNLAAWWVHAGHSPPPNWAPFLVGLVATAIALWRSPRTPAGFAGSVAGVYLCFFAVAKQAFCNYYFWTIGALCCAMG